MCSLKRAQHEVLFQLIQIGFQGGLPEDKEGFGTKRCLLLGRKVMTNLDSILKNRDITLPTKVRLVKATVFPVVKYGCESWTVRKLKN